MSESPGIEEDVRAELCKRLLPALDHDFKTHPEVDLNFCNLLTPNAGGDGNGREVEAKNIFQELRPDGVQPKAWVIAGEAGQGRTTLARRIAHAWLRKENTFPNLLNYKLVLLVAGEKAASNRFWDILKPLLPDTIKRWSDVVLSDWLEEPGKLLIIDDLKFTGCIKKLSQDVLDWSELEVLIFSGLADAFDTISFIANNKPILALKILGLNEKGAIDIASKEISGNHLSKFREWVDNNRKIVEEVINYPVLARLVCRAWASGLLIDVKTTSEILWAVVNVMMCKNKELIAQDILSNWITQLGHVAFDSLEKRTNLSKTRIEDLAKHYPMPVSSLLIDCLYEYASLSRSCVSLPHSLVQFLAAWFVLNKLLKGNDYKLITRNIPDTDKIGIFIAGHLERVLKENLHMEISETSIVAKQLLHYKDIGRDQLGFLIKVLNEVLLHPKFVASLVCEVQLPFHWIIFCKSILFLPIYYLLQRCTPEKLILVVNQKMQETELEDVVSHISHTNISLGLCILTHLEWENAASSDYLMETLLKSKVKLEDFVGCLSINILSAIASNEAAAYLVCLSLRVRDYHIAKKALECPQYLHSLLCLEIYFDFSILFLKDVHTSPLRSLLIDLHFKDVDDHNVHQVCDFVSKVSKSFSGIHIKRSSLTLHGSTNFLKSLHQKGVILHANQEIVLKYQKWRHPSIDSITPKGKIEEEFLHLMDPSDCLQYSNNEIRSSYVPSQQCVIEFTNFLDSQHELAYLSYICGNYSITKYCDGKIVVTQLRGRWTRAELRMFQSTSNDRGWIFDS